MNKVVIKFSYQYKEDKMAAKDRIIYGFLWLFLAIIIAGIPYQQDSGNVGYLLISLVLLVVSVKQFFEGFKRYKNLKMIKK